MLNFNFSTIGWEAIAAIGTVLSAVVALGIALFSHLRSAERENLTRKKEAIETLLIPIRKELDEFSRSKWDLWSIQNRWHRLSDKKNDFPLQYYILQKANPKLVEKIESFDKNFSLFVNFQNTTKAQKLLSDLIVSTVRSFVLKKKIEITGNAGRLPDDDGAILNFHWRGLVDDGLTYSATVTLFSLVLWKASLSEFVKDRNISAKSLSFTFGDLVFKPSFNLDVTNELLNDIENALSKHSEFIIIDEYRKKWRELSYEGNKLIEEIEQWYSSF